MSYPKFLSILLIILIIGSLSILGFIHYSTADYQKDLSNIRTSIQDFLYDYEDFQDELPVIIDQEGSPTRSVSIYKSQAIEDIEYLFSLLKYGYAGYEYFGGDQAFDTARDNSLWSLGTIKGDKLEIKDFLDILYNELRFIQDGHFTLGPYVLCDYSKYYSSRKRTFYKDVRGIYTFVDDKPYYLTSVNGQDP